MKKVLFTALLLSLFGEVFPEVTAQDVPIANLLVSDAIISGPATVGNNITYYIAAHNVGPSNATGIVMTDILSPFTDFVSASPSCTNIDGVITCDMGDMGVHGITNVTIVVKPTAAGLLCNYASVFSDITDTNPADNTGHACTTVAAATAGADLAVSMIDSPDPNTEGSNLTYSLRVRNNGPSSASSVVLTDVFPENVTFVSASPACTNNGGIVTCNIPSLARNTSVTETIVVSATTTGQVCGTAMVTAAEVDPSTDNNTSTACTEITATPQPVNDLAIVKITAPSVVPLSAKKPSRTVVVQVQIQNRSPHAETISSLGGLVDLTVESLGVCSNLTATLHVGKPQKVPPTVTLPPKKTLTVYFDVTFTTNCVNDPTFGTPANPGHGDYRYFARVHHEALPGGVADTHPEDDVCPRSVVPPYDVDPNPDGSIKDKGCGAKKADGTYGGDVITDVWRQ